MSNTIGKSLDVGKAKPLDNTELLQLQQEMQLLAQLHNHDGSTVGALALMQKGADMGLTDQAHPRHEDFLKAAKGALVRGAEAQQQFLNDMARRVINNIR